MMQREVERYPLDRGCELAPKCLECPRPACKYDSHSDNPYHLNPNHVKVLQLYQAQIPVEEIVKQTGYKKRTIFRITQERRL